VTITYQFLQGGPATRWGASTGQADLGSLATRVESAGGPVVVLDFEGIEAANGSYLRATALWMLRCAIDVARRGNDVSFFRDKRWGYVGGGREGIGDIRFKSGV
jgi:hypothetical protein